MGWDCWPPGSLEDVVNLYGGPRRFLLVNIPAVLLALGADFLGSMRALLSLDVLQPTVRAFRLDGIYSVRGFKRHYIDAPLSCTFKFPGDWIYDPALEMAMQQRRDSGRTYRTAGGDRGQVTSSTPLPLVSLCPQAGAKTGQSLTLTASSAGKSSSLAEALGSSEEAQALLIRRFLKGSLREAQAQPVAATALSASVGGRESYRLEMQVRYSGASGAADVGAAEDELSVWTTVQLVDGGGSRASYLLFLTAIAPGAAPAVERDRVRIAAESLEKLQTM